MVNAVPIKRKASPPNQVLWKGSERAAWKDRDPLTMRSPRSLQKSAMACRRGTASNSVRGGDRGSAYQKASDGARTRDNQLGKLVLYQLSYARAQFTIAKRSSAVKLRWFFGSRGYWLPIGTNVHSSLTELDRSRSSGSVVVVTNQEYVSPLLSATPS